ncbi:MAG: hypothetical protein Q8N05_08490 [Bacteroidota bacterium]|nr:hypothetical protein [Bacteroidota bacterium]
MSKLSTLNYLISSYYAGKKEVEILRFAGFASENYCKNENQIGFEPSQNSIDAILSFASQYEVLKSGNIGNIELNLN